MSAEMAQNTDELNATTKLDRKTEREIVWRRVFIGQSQREVAGEFDIGKGTVNKIMREYKRISGPEIEGELIDEFDGVVEPYAEG